jgi:hypothetical protein
VWDDRAVDYGVALDVFGQWARAEPGFRTRTVEEIDAEREQRSARIDGVAAPGAPDRPAPAACYDAARAQARLELLEEQAVLASKVSERDEIAGLYPAMPEARRQSMLAGLNAAITARQGEVQRLVSLVGDGEAVADENGWLPAERRDLMLAMYSARRVTEVRELRLSAARRQVELTAAKGRPQRARIRAALPKDTCRLEFLEGIPPMTAPDMCSECISPARWHRPDSTYGNAGQVSGPCLAPVGATKQEAAPGPASPLRPAVTATAA